MSTTATLAVARQVRPIVWVLACASAEGIGMTAAAAAARVADGLPGGGALALIVLGGLVEGTALGILQAMWMARRFPGVSIAGWILTTVLVAGIGWSLASAPAAVGGESTDGTPPPVILILTGAAALGAVMGAVMGFAQAWTLKGHVRHPWRWISISAAAWTPTMVIIFAGATAPDASWGTGTVILLGTATGLIAGAALGAMSLALMRTLEGQSVWSGLLGPAVQHNLFGLGRSLVLLRVTGAVSGRTFELPVQYARDAETLVVFPGGAEHKTWWRNLEEPSAMSVWIDGRWRQARGRVVRGNDRAAFDRLRHAYSHRWRALRVGDDAVLVRIDLEVNDVSLGIVHEGT